VLLDSGRNKVGSWSGKANATRYAGEESNRALCDKPTRMMSHDRKVMYVGDHYRGGTCFQRLRAMKDVGFQVTSIDTKPEEVRKKENQLFYRLRRKFFGPSDLAGANEKMLQLLSNDYHHLLWIDKGMTVKPETLRTVIKISPETIIAGYSPDDMLNPDNQSKHFLEGLQYYDIFFTTKSFGVEELKKLGCKRVEFIDNGYDPYTHRPVAVTKEDRSNFGGSVGFIGAYEQERAESVYFLSKNGITVRIWGSGWRKKKHASHSNIKIENIPLWGDDYAKAICSFDISLNFLRKANRDLQTTRSIEIAACGGFMLAERTTEHLSLFNEGVEAEFFSSNEELLRKVRYYLEHDEKRKSIAWAGYKRCINSGYRNQDRLNKMIDYVQSECSCTK